MHHSTLYKVYGARQTHGSFVTHREALLDLSKISKGGQIFAGAGIVYFIASFLPWYTASGKVQGVEVASDSANAWGDLGFLWGSLWALLFIAAAVIILLPAFGTKPPKLPSIAFLAVAALATLFTLLKLIIGEDDVNGIGFKVEVSASFGLFLAVIAAAAATFGGYLLFTESGGSLDDLKDPNKLKSSFSTGGTGGSVPPPPPPPPGMTPPPPPPPPPPSV